jgi:hypothetical protein
MPKGRAMKGRLAESKELLLAFWRHPTRGSSAALFRVAFGLLSTWTAIGVGLNLERYFADGGMIPWRVAQRWGYASYSAFSLAPDSEALLRAHFVVFLAASLLLTVGVGARASAMAVFLVNLSLQHRNGLIVNSGDRLFMIMAFYAAFAPLSQRWSLASLFSRRRKRGRLASGFGLRLMQLQIAYVYLSAAFSKLGQPRWQNGRALRDVLSSPLYCEWPTYIDFWPLVYFLTWSTLVFELGFPLGVWFKRYRPWLIIAGVLFHLGIEVTMTIPMFSWIMIIGYIPFLTDDETEALGRLVRRPGPTLRAWLSPRRPRAPVPTSP